MPDYVGQQLGNYRLVRLLGHGGFAEIYLGEHVYLKSQAAIKVLYNRLAKQALEEFLAEARALVQLIHPYIVRVLDFGLDKELPFLIMDYAPYGTLRDRHPKGSRVPLPNVISYVKHIAEALQYAHDKQLIHRDIKPENMLLGRNNEVLLSDFGLVQIAYSSEAQITNEEMAGTVPYTAPEQLQGKPRKASDLYSLGVVVYEWLTSACPFQGTFVEIASQHVFTPPPGLRAKNPMISRAVEEVVLKALEKDPHHRFASVREFATALEQAYQLEQGESEWYEAPTLEVPIALGDDSPHDQNESIDWTRRADSETPSTLSTTIQPGNRLHQRHEDTPAPTSNTPENIQHSDPGDGLLDAIFLFNAPLPDFNEFYGRVRERETVLSRTRKGASSSIVGPRRIGKTWLLDYMRLIAPSRFGTRIRIGYLDATSVSCTTVAGFVATALEELNVPHLISTSAHPDLATLEKVVKALKAQNQITLLCIDEFEGFSKRQEYNLDFFIGLRAMTQVGLCLVVVSKKPLIDIVGDYGKTSGFFNIFEQLSLEPFSMEEAYAFAQTKAAQAGFSDQERDILLKYGRTDEDRWPPARLQLVGEMLLKDKMLALREGPQYYRPNDLRYWKEFEQRLEEKYRGVVR